MASRGQSLSLIAVKRGRWPASRTAGPPELTGHPLAAHIQARRGAPNGCGHFAGVTLALRTNCDHSLQVVVV